MKNKERFLIVLLLTFLASYGTSKELFVVEAPMVESLSVPAVKQKMLRVSDGVNSEELNFMLAVAYYNEGKYRQAYRTLRKVKSIAYLDDYITFYRSMSAFAYSDSARLLSHSLDGLYEIIGKADGPLSEEIRKSMPQLEFKMAEAFLKSRDITSSFDHYVRAKKRGFSNLDEEIALLAAYANNDREMAKALIVDLLRNLESDRLEKLLGKIPSRLRRDIQALLEEEILEVVIEEAVPDEEEKLLSSIRTAVGSRNSARVRSLAIKYLEDHPRGRHLSSFYQVLNRFLDQEIFTRGRPVSYYRDLFLIYERAPLERFAIRAFQTPNLDMAEELLKIILQSNPHYERGRFLLASLYEDKGDNSKAMQQYKRIVDAYPRSNLYQRALFKYAWLNMLESRNQDCVDIFSRYINEIADRRDWTVTAALYFKSRCLSRKADDEKASKLIDRLILEYPFSFYSIVSMGERGISLVDRLWNSIQPLDEVAGAISPQNLKSIRTATVLLRLGLFDWALRELSSLNMDRMDDVYIQFLPYIYKYAGDRHMSIMSSSRLLNNLRHYPSLVHAMIHYPKYHFDLVKEYSENNGLDPFLVLAIMRRESAFQEEARSSAGARGLMQLMPATAVNVDPKAIVDGLKDPEKNIRIATAYLDRLMKRYDSQIIYVLASYNAGENALDRWLSWYGKRLDNMEFIENIPYLETRNYVKAVLANYYMYRALYDKKEVDFDITKGKLR